MFDHDGVTHVTSKQNDDHVSAAWGWAAGERSPGGAAPSLLRPAVAELPLGLLHAVLCSRHAVLTCAHTAPAAVHPAVRPGHHPRCLLHQLRHLRHVPRRQQRRGHEGVLHQLRCRE